jgi:pimeloyl-ACP methyl ester carboxylesterase
VAVGRINIALSVVITLVAVTAVAFLPSVQARGKALPMLADAVGLDVPRPFAPDVSRTDVALRGVTGHLYVPATDAPPVLLVPGAAPRGKDDPRVERLARSIARAGRTVFVPDLVLSERRLDEADLHSIVEAGVALTERPGAEGRVALLGISYGGSFALIAAADPRLDGRVALVATFGAYFDLRGVIQAVSTGTSLVEGRRVPWQGHPLAAQILSAQAVALAPEESHAELVAALGGRADPSRLPSEARAVFDLVRNEDPQRTFELAGLLPAAGRGVLERFSPSTVAGSIEAPVVSMHSTDDPAVPYGELLRLEHGLPGARIVSVESFRHVDLRAGGPGAWATVLGDITGAWRFASWFLEAQE